MLVFLKINAIFHFIKPNGSWCNNMPLFFSSPDKNVGVMPPPAFHCLHHLLLTQTVNLLASLMQEEHIVYMKGSFAKIDFSALRYVSMEKVTLPRRGGDFDSLLLRTEAFWIHHLNTLAPHGLNVDLDLKPFYLTHHGIHRPLCTHT